jgi:uncharacterized membrane protein
MITPFMILFFILFPAFAIYLCKKSPLIDRLGAVVVCYIAGIALGNTGVFPENFAGVQDAFMTVTVPIALPLMFFSLDMKRWSRLAGKSLLSFGLQTVSIIIVSIGGYFIFRDVIGAESWKLAGMFIGVYTGGTVNLAAIGTALQVDPALYVASHASDVVVSSVYLLFLITVGQRVILKFLPAFSAAGNVSEDISMEGMNSYDGIFGRKVFLPLLGALALAVLIFAFGGALTLVVPKEAGMVVAILSITTLGIAASFVPRIRAIKMTYQLGQYFILVFCLVVGSMADISKLIGSAPAILGYVGFTIACCLVLHVALCRIFGVDTDTMIITSTAGINSPPLVPVVAAALKNRELVVSGVITGIIGWVIGSYLGITFAYLLQGLGL